MTIQSDGTFDGNPSPPKTNTVINKNIVGDISATQETGMQDRSVDQEVALNIEDFEKNPSPPRMDSTIGNA